MDIARYMHCNTNIAVMETAVWGAVQGCQYDDPQKKERLCSAVMEALSGRKTMKAAAAMHEVGPATPTLTVFPLYALPMRFL